MAENGKLDDYIKRRDMILDVMAWRGGISRQAAHQWLKRNMPEPDEDYGFAAVFWLRSKYEAVKRKHMRKGVNQP